MFVALTGLLGFIGIGGLSLAGLSFFGIGGGLIAWFAAKRIPWKLIVSCAAGLLIVLVVYAGYQTFKDTQKKLSDALVELALEKIVSAAEKARADDYNLQHSAQVARINKLEADRTEVAEQATLLSAQILDMRLEQEFKNDVPKAVDGFNTYNRELNSLLESASRGARPGDLKAAGADKAGPTGAAATLQ